MTQDGTKLKHEDWIQKYWVIPDSSHTRGHNWSGQRRVTNKGVSKLYMGSNSGAYQQMEYIQLDKPYSRRGLGIEVVCSEIFDVGGTDATHRQYEDESDGNHKFGIHDRLQGTCSGKIADVERM